MADMFIVDTSELDDLAADMLREIPKVTKDTRATATRSLDVTESTSRVFAPVLSGALQASITTDVETDGLGGEVGPTVDYGGYVENGTSVMGPQPYMGPGFDAGERALVAGVEKVANGVLE